MATLHGATVGAAPGIGDHPAVDGLDRREILNDLFPALDLIEGAVAVGTAPEGCLDRLDGGGIERRAAIGRGVSGLATRGLADGVALLGLSAEGSGRGVSPLLQLGVLLFEGVDASVLVTQFLFQLA
jgi:hypothetical protein